MHVTFHFPPLLGDWIEVVYILIKLPNPHLPTRVMAALLFRCCFKGLTLW